MIETNAGALDPQTFVRPVGQTASAPRPAGEFDPRETVEVVDAPRPKRQQRNPTIGTVVTHTYEESGSGRELVRAGLVIGETDEGVVVGWFTEISDPLPVDILVEVT